MGQTYPCPCDMCDCSHLTLNGEDEWCDDCEMGDHEEDRKDDGAE